MPAEHAPSREEASERVCPGGGGEGGGAGVEGCNSWQHNRMKHARAVLAAHRSSCWWPAPCNRAQGTEGLVLGGRPRATR